MLINQRVLAAQVKKLFPNEKILENVRKHTNLKYLDSGAYLEFDVWIPSLKIGFEFQDDYHYVSVFYNQDSQERVFHKDSSKRFVAHQNRVSLIVVPCWWSGTAESLAATIQYHRPDMFFAETSLPISLNPPLGYFKSMDIPNIGDLMAPSFPVGNFDVSASPIKWWLGEKYDGVRYCWHPSQLRAYTRYGKQVELLPKIKYRMAPIFMDGEFWFGRGNYHFTGPLISDAVDQVIWEIFRMVAFDVPSPNVENKTFEERYKLLLRHVNKHSPILIVAPRVLCKGNLHLNLYVQGIINDGGEGAILRAVRSLYERARSTSLVKLKTAYGDKEAIVVDVSKHSVMLKLPHGATFAVPSENVHVTSLAVGDVVSFSYENYARRDLPVNPTIYRIRTDLSWQEVVYSSVKEEKFLSGTIVGFTTQPPNYWTKANMRKFMENAAHARHLDPLRADSWYSLPVSYIYDLPGGRIIMQKLKGYINALQCLFPEITFDKNAFARSSWQDIGTRRNFFENYAQENEFDPLVPENWYAQPIEKFLVNKGLKNVLSYHKNNLGQALLDLFPNIGLVQAKFQPHYVYWNSIENRRSFFKNYAKEHGFDFNNIEHWYSHPFDKIMGRQETRRIIQYHGLSLPQALSELFPDLEVNPARFQTPNSFQTAVKRRRLFEKFAKAKNFDPLVADNWYSCLKKDIDSFRGVLMHHKYSFPTALIDLFPEVSFDRAKFFRNKGWKSPKKQRQFFENYAKQRKFDPLIADNWYKQSRNDVLQTQIGPRILRHYGNSVANTITALFPEIGIEKSKFTAHQKWSTKENRRKFFLHYAKQNNFDPLNPENWYKQQRQQIVAAPGAYGVLFHYNNNVQEALVDLFPDVKFDPLQFSTNTNWSDRSKRRKFFEDLANALDFDPMNAHNWYNLPKSKVLATKGGVGLLSHYDNNLAEALSDAFPEISLNAHLFSNTSH